MADKKISAFDAKTHLSQLLRDAEAGQAYIIERHGKPVARLEPIKEVRKTDFKELARKFEEFSKSLKSKGRINVKELIEEGRRF